MIKSKCQKKNDNNYAGVVANFLVQYGKCFSLFFVICLVSLVRQNLGKNQDLGKILSFGLFSSLVMLIVYYIDSYAYHNMMIGIGAYLGFVILKDY